MLHSNTTMVEIWTNAAKRLNAEFTMPIQHINGGYGGLYRFKINIKYKNIDIRIHSGIDELGLEKDEIKACDITITAKKQTSDTIELSIWRKDFFDKLFGKNLLKTGYKKFDKIIGLKASRNIERYLPKIFENEKIRTELINEKYRTYNVYTENNEIIIQRKSGIRIKDSDMILVEYQKFLIIINGLMNAKII